MTAATWKYDTGAVGTLLHGTSLHGGEYAIELEVYADGVSVPIPAYGRTELTFC